jgi:hypothetical protein
MDYCTACYTCKENYPFGFCKKCWIKQGKPQPMDRRVEE